MAKIREKIEEFVPDQRLVDERGATEQRYRIAEGQAFIADTGAIHLRDSPIERALTKKILTREQGEAAQKYYIHWYRGGMAGVIGSHDVLKVFGGDNNFSHMASTENALFHRQRYWQAAKSLKERRAPFEAVVLHEKPFEAMGAEYLGWKNRPQAYAGAIEYVRGILDTLCGDWGIG